ncbi:polynucleotide adenylyltransferase PcnB [Halorhodospira halochloris]|uniref:polynucleotide adenylyltransferase PcnB n=1 Tax=Halorhodospira halochloris TaxID=1052 RepID=UPI001EE8A85A|nr:polynucleotide adenylyltransferase PcnB [Halorhodospira halochloris]MCG5548766.1 polynucleotide adenylyltransferase PcnB [Halorhodospira halochloris]
MSLDGPKDVEPRIIPRDAHRVSRADISDNALKVLYRLRKAGYQAYMVGGGVRDLSLGREPKDFDVATDARPEEVRGLFRNCRLIGRRFRLAHVHFGPEIIEVATFRAMHDPDQDDLQGDVVYEKGRIVRDNVYGTLSEDALRRDFTVNSLYYNIDDFSVVDHAGGMDDLHAGVIRLIGDPHERFQEDPVRMLRAVRFALKLGFRIHPDTARPIPELAPTLADMPAARLFDEVLKLFLSGMALESFEMLRHFSLFDPLLPVTSEALKEDGDESWVPFLAAALRSTDERVGADKPVTPAFLFAALLWPAVRKRERELRAAGEQPAPAIQQAGSEVQSAQQSRIALPKRFSIPMREIWSLQARLERRGARRAQRLMRHPRFRAAYDFLELRAGSGDAPSELVQWWRQLQQDSPHSPAAKQQGKSGEENGGATASADEKEANKPRRGSRRRGKRGGAKGRSKVSEEG